MSFESYGTITEQDVEDARRHVAEMERTPEAARKRLIEAGVLTKDGEPRWPVKGAKRSRRTRPK